VGQPLPAELELLSAVTVGQQAEVADALETGRERAEESGA
jgi:hypothetical protein